MSRKVYIETTIVIALTVDEGVDISDVTDTLDITINHSGATVEDVEIEDFEIIDSK